MHENLTHREFALCTKAIEVVKSYVGISKLGYHHFDGSLLKAWVSCAESMLQHLPCAKVLDHISKGMLMKD